MRKCFVAVAVAALAAGVLASPGGPLHAAPEGATAPGIGGQLRYIGRDNATGMPVTVNDGFIAEVERSFAVYGIEETGAVPPPPVDGPDIARLDVPAIGVDAPVGRYGLDRYGRLDVPQDTSTVGWNPAYADLPGSGGATFLAAHFEYGGRPGVFNRLSSLQPGDAVTVVLSDGASYRYRVTSVVDYVLESIDMGALLRGREGVESLTLMTCSGRPNARGYSERTVVLAERVD